ncbi:hypothetical protein NUH88_15620 [Nisaea acidiphila]|uniref:Uncharacterized protein n=1 Tax=Nisaea acidiphila TaxID=1862145 RepID=A0A9J7AMZ8_9PROT|nr:hypothetical protein [Nisaea acidiphila]UUX48824.1 hypothetical protein NUH88_15620 [Nisaea acidiphila]
MAAPTTHRSGIARYSTIQQAEAFKQASLPTALKTELAAIRAANSAAASGKASDTRELAEANSSRGFAEALANALHAGDKPRPLSGFRPLARFPMHGDE